MHGRGQWRGTQWPLLLCHCSQGSPQRPFLRDPRDSALHPLWAGLTPGTSRVLGPKQGRARQREKACPDFSDSKEVSSKAPGHFWRGRFRGSRQRSGPRQASRPLSDVGASGLWKGGSLLVHSPALLPGLPTPGAQEHLSGGSAQSMACRCRAAAGLSRTLLCCPCSGSYRRASCGLVPTSCPLSTQR